ncbi:hypothetical protein NZA46_001255, partial [Campylobacter coli]|nr:hypothetical protein [Campylobacter coli]
MKNIVFHSDGFGDLLVCFKALYAIKQLYPEYKLFLLTNGLMESDFLEKIQSKNPVIFITTRRQGLYFKKLKFLNVQKCIVFPHLISIISKNLTTPLPFFRAKKHMSEIVLKLVRMINTR